MNDKIDEILERDDYYEPAICKTPIPSSASPADSTADFLNEIQRDITGLMNELFELGYTEDGTVGQKANAIRHKLIVRKCLSR